MEKRWLYLTGSFALFVLGIVLLVNYQLTMTGAATGSSEVTATWASAMGLVLILIASVVFIANRK